MVPEKPADKPFSELVNLVSDYYCPPSVTVQRYNFNSRTQKGETVSQFIAELRRLSEHCDFKATLDDMMRDRIVNGVRNPSVQRRLLADSGLTFNKAYELVQSAESAEKNAQRSSAQLPWLSTWYGFLYECSRRYAFCKVVWKVFRTLLLG